MPVLCHATYAFAGTAKPMLVAALVTGAGVTAFATPLSDTAANNRMSHPSAVRTQFARLAVKGEVKPVIAVKVGPAGARPLGVSPVSIDDRKSATPAPIAAQQETGLPGIAPIDFVLAGKVETPGLAAIDRQPEPRAPASPGYMPAAELKAMMAGVAASRGDLDGLARPDVAITVAPAPGAEKLAGEPALGQGVQRGPGIDFEAAALVNGAPAGRVPLRIADGENISVRLGDILGALQPLMDSTTYDALASSQAAGEYVTFDTLRAKGIAVRFDAQDRVVFGSS